MTAGFMSGVRSGLERHRIAVAVVFFIFALLVMWLVFRATERSLLQGDAVHAATRWAEHVARNVPDIDLLLDGEPPSSIAQDHLAGLRSAGDIVRFDIFSAQGRLRLRSESLSGLSAGEAGVLDPVAAQVAGTGAQRSGIVHGDGAQRPVLGAYAYVPVRVAGRLAGVVRIDVNHTAQAARVRLAFAKIAASVCALMLVPSLLVISVLRRRHHDQLAADHRMRYLANHDPLTGAANRAAFHLALVTACVPADPLPASALAVLCVDLDHFKDVNDSHGHAAGDEMLRQVRTRLGELVRHGDVVARLGGDEFAVLQHDVRHLDDVVSLASRISLSLSVPYELSGQRVNGGASVGAAVYGADGTDADALMLRADSALYAAKAKGRGTYAFFDLALEQQRDHRRRLGQELRTAVMENGLSMDFQPLYEPDGRTLRGYEALARWHHATLGPISPAEFIPMAEETSLIVDLGRWALRHACDEAATWPGELSVAVNLSIAQFRDGPALVAYIADVLSQTSLPARRLEIEITESLLISDTENALRCLHALHDLGVHVALDDFGTGFSSLAYLWRFPFDKVKIDRVFTHGLGRDDKVTLIVKSIVSLAHELRIRVNAEGIETEAQMSMMREYGCDELQGFLLGRPGVVDVGLQSRGRVARKARPPRTDFGSLDLLPMSL